MTQWLSDILIRAQSRHSEGEVSTYLPEFAAAKSTDFGFALHLNDGTNVAQGTHYSFTVQSVIKVVTLLVAIHEHGTDATFARSGCDIARAQYNSVANYNEQKRSTANPFVNAGAIATLDLLEAGGPEELLKKVLDAAKFLTGNQNLQVNQSVADSEYDLGDRNRSIAYHLASFGAITKDIDGLLRAYFETCSIEFNVSDLANLARVLGSEGGIDGPNLHVSATDLQKVRRLMLVAGMYEDSAEFATLVGVPSKCGVSGSMIGTIEGVGGVGVYGPALNATGNSVVGMEVMRLLAEHFID